MRRNNIDRGGLPDEARTNIGAGFAGIARFGIKRCTAAADTTGAIAPPERIER
jgi:hypothetical protein